MIRIRLCVVAEGVTMDAQTNQITIYSILEDIQAQGFPMIVPRIAFLAVLEREPDDNPRVETEFSVRLGDRALLTQMMPIDFEDKLRSRALIKIGGVAVPQPGALVFRLTVPGGETAEYALNVGAPPPVVEAPLAPR